MKSENQNHGQVGDMLSSGAKSILRAKCDAPEDAEFEYIRKGKFIVYISITRGLELFGKYRFDCRRGTMSEA